MNYNFISIWKIDFTGGSISGLPGISSPSLALQFLSNNLAPPPPSLMASPQLVQHMNSNIPYNTTSVNNPLLYGIASKPIRNNLEEYGTSTLEQYLSKSLSSSSASVTTSSSAIENQKYTGSPEIKHQISRQTQPISSPTLPHRTSPKFEELAPSSPRPSLAVMSANEGCSANPSRVPSPPYGLS